MAIEIDNLPYYGTVLVFSLLIFIYWVGHRRQKKPKPKSANLVGYRANDKKAEGRVSAADDNDSTNVDEIDPIDLSVKIVDNHMVIEGHRNEDDHGLIRPLALRYKLPKTSDDRVSSTLMSDGMTPKIEENSNVEENTSEKKSGEVVIGEKGDGFTKK